MTGNKKEKATNKTHIITEWMDEKGVGTGGGGGGRLEQVTIKACTHSSPVEMISFEVAPVPNRHRHFCP